MQRIISLVPSQTELLYDLGLDVQVVGITKFCVHPNHWFRSKTRVGGTKTVNIDKVISLQPTLVLANKEENVKEQIEALEAVAQVYVSDIADLAGALHMIKDIGKLTGKHLEAAHIVSRIEKLIQQLESSHLPKQIKPRTCYFIWRDPYMAAGGNTFINDMMEHCGFENMFNDVERYPEVTIEQLLANDCQLLLLSSEPYPFKQKHIDEMQAQLPNTKIILVDGEMFSWYGSRLIKTAAYFQQLRQQIFQ
jgi:ABC-type Fe3+-hydroxamate transport system substrate-binding protein